MIFDSLPVTLTDVLTSWGCPRRLPHPRPVPSPAFPWPPSAEARPTQVSHHVLSHSHLALKSAGFSCTFNASLFLHSLWLDICHGTHCKPSGETACVCTCRKGENRGKRMNTAANISKTVASLFLSLSPAVSLREGQLSLLPGPAATHGECPVVRGRAGAERARSLTLALQGPMLQTRKWWHWLSRAHRASRPCQIRPSAGLWACKAHACPLPQLLAHCAHGVELPDSANKGTGCPNISQTQTSGYVGNAFLLRRCIRKDCLQEHLQCLQFAFKQFKKKCTSERGEAKVAGC